MQAAKEKTLIYLVVLIYIRIVYDSVRKAAAKKSPIGPTKKNRDIVPLENQRSPRKRIGESGVQLRLLHRALGTMYFRARYYDPTTGEFVSPDPLEYIDGMSLNRGYFLISSVDPIGLDLIRIPEFGEGSEGCACYVPLDPVGPVLVPRPIPQSPFPARPSIILDEKTAIAFGLSKCGEVVAQQVQRQFLLKPSVVATVFIIIALSPDTCDAPEPRLPPIDPPDDPGPDCNCCELWESGGTFNCNHAQPFEVRNCVQMPAKQCLKSVPEDEWDGSGPDGIPSNELDHRIQRACVPDNLKDNDGFNGGPPFKMPF